ncbi:High-affinity glucose transporter [Purpureocillium lavendulum]|uniref:High-affinity glucose transporter n=1 Tax=Purpureocillium lavendulum TaxID=1247861 RepID=A0AB34FP92_9HYPO|nr:High-affinity glucose transporter [Purpureocillium lavendulum]
MSLNPDKKPVLAVVGVGPGIGEAVARHFAAKGFAVALIARTEDKLRRIRDAITDAHGPGAARHYATDVRDEAQVTQAFASVRRELGPVNVLVYNAGSRRIRRQTILETSTDEFESFTRVNMFGAFFAARCVLPDMLAAGAGTVIFTGATGSVRGSTGLSSFSPGKFGLRALSQIIAREFQAKGIHAAHVIVDGPVDSDVIGGYVRKHWANEPDKLKEIDRYLMRPGDIAELYWFLHQQPRSTWTQELDKEEEEEEEEEKKKTKKKEKKP